MPAGNGDADAAPDRDLLALDRERDLQRVDHALRDGEGTLQLDLVRQEDSELVAAEPGRQVVRSDAAADPVRDRGEEPVAGRVAERVVDDLEVVEVEEEHDRAEPLPRGDELLLDALGEEGAVGQPGERVVIGLVPELLLEPRQLGERLLELAVLEGDRRLVGEGLEEAEIVLVEARAFGQPVGHRHRADQPGLGDQRADHRLADGRTRARSLSGDGAEEPLALGGDAGMDRVVRGDLHRHHRRRDLVLDRRRPKRLAALAASVEGDLGDLRPEHRAGVVEQRDERRIELRRVLHDPARLVEQLEAVVLLALGDVGAVGEEERRQRHDQQPDGQRVDPHHGDREQRQARVGEGDHAPELEHLGQLLELRRATGQRDRGRDRQGSQQAGDEHRRERRDPVRRAGPAAERTEAVEDDEGHRRDEREVGEVERDLHDRLARGHEQGDGRADEHGQQVLVRRHEEEPEHGRDLAQRERVGLPPEVDEDHLGLDGQEGDGQQRPRNGERARHRPEELDVVDVDEQRQAAEGDREEPDPGRRWPDLSGAEPHDEPTPS